MTRVAQRLTARTVAATNAAGVYGDGNGLYLRVAPGGSKSWLYRFQLNGRRRDLGLGPAALIGLAQARELAMAARKQVLEGIDPIDRRRAERLAMAAAAAKAVTFEAAAGRYMAAHGGTWKNAKHAAQWQSTLQTYAFPVLGDLDVRAIDVGLVLKVLEPIWHDKPETASRVRGRIEAVLDWATARKLREGDNPARWRGLLEALLPARSRVRRVQHFAALPYGEMPAFWSELALRDGMAAMALRVVILTAARSGEVRGMVWSELDLEAGVWTVPAARMKAGREHRVPLPAPALELLQSLAQARMGDLVFPGARGGALSDMSLTAVLRRMCRNDLTVHGFRSTFRDWSAEQTAFDRETCEAALAHVVGNKVEAAYRRGDQFDKRRRLMAAWGAFVTGPAEVPGEVIAMGKGRYAKS